MQEEIRVHQNNGAAEDNAESDIEHLHLLLHFRNKWNR